MAVTTENAGKVVEACDSAGVRLGVFFQDRLQPDLVRLKAFLDRLAVWAGSSWSPAT